MNIHTSKWAPILGVGVRWTPKFSKSDFKGQNPLDWRVLYIIRKLLELRYLKWVHMTHLDTSNTSYDQKKGWVGIAQISLCAGGMWHTLGKLSTKVTTLLQASSQSEVFTQSYVPPKLRESQLWEFRDSHLGVLGQNVIWVLVLWSSTKYSIRGKVVASPKSGPWWVLWVCVCQWLIRAPKCYNYALAAIWFVEVHVCDWIAYQSS
jgi:hypothetical protein